MPNFNTSNVTIQQQCEAITHINTIHFNTSNVTIQLDTIKAMPTMYKFQYI